jgi:predicted DNA-binding protein (MmcQ/YjbR family)
MTDQDWNPYFRALWNQCSAKPEAVEDHPWGETVFKVRAKVFAFLGSSDCGRVVVKVAPDQVDGLLALPFIQRSPYIGRYGWLAVSISDDDALELAQELIDASYEIIAAKAPGRIKSSERGDAVKQTPLKKPPREK